MTEWEIAQSWELDWHSSCINSLNEELKQIVYAEKMGLIRTPTPKTPYNYDLEGKSVLDCGGGAYSLLLKCVNYHIDKLGKTTTTVTDPLMMKYPQWVRDRYTEAGITFQEEKGEDVGYWDVPYDEVWIYNVLEHTENPKKVVENALEVGNIVRIFEWLGVPKNVGHIHTLNEQDLNKWLGGEGKVEKINRNGAVGTAFYGVFKGNNYEN